MLIQRHVRRCNKTDGLRSIDLNCVEKHKAVVYTSANGAQVERFVIPQWEYKNARFICNSPPFETLGAIQ